MLKYITKSNILLTQQKSDQEEALEVAVQCLESVYNCEQSDGESSNDPLSQIDIFQLYLDSVSSSPEKKEQGEEI